MSKLVVVAVAFALLALMALMHAGVLTPTMGGVPSGSVAPDAADAAPIEARPGHALGDRSARRNVPSAMSSAKEVDTESPKKLAAAGRRRTASSAYCYEEPGKPLLAERVITPAPVVKEYLKNVVLMHMVSPTRYSLVPLLHKHYSPYFTHQIFTGPQNATVGDFAIEGHDVVFGTMQYLALMNVIRRIAAATPEQRAAQGLPAAYADIEGFFFLGDDMLLQPWMLYGRNKRVVWSAGMGIANADNWRNVRPVPAMSMEKSRLKMNWPFWFKGRVGVLRVFNDSVVDWGARENLYRASLLTPPRVYHQSKYHDPTKELCCSEKHKYSHMFYGLVDAFYVPGGETALRWCKYGDACKRQWMHLETAIPTTLRMVSPSYEVLNLQYYWASISAAKCVRGGWAIDVDGIHRCRHDHTFARLLYGGRMTHADRLAVKANATRRRQMLAMSGLDANWSKTAYSTREFDVRMKKK